MFDFKSWKTINLENATVTFYENDEYLAFDSTKCPPPEPMINARVGLNNLKSNQKLIMHNHRNPVVLLSSIKPFYDVSVTCEDGVYELIFTKLKDHDNFDESCKDHP